MRRSVDRSSDGEPSLLCRFSQDCIIATRGCDFREGQVWMTRLWPSLLGLARVVEPATILRWHRARFRSYWCWRLGSAFAVRHPGRCSSIRMICVARQRGKLVSACPTSARTKIHKDTTTDTFINNSLTIQRANLDQLLARIEGSRNKRSSAPRMFRAHATGCRSPLACPGMKVQRRVAGWPMS